MMKKILVTGAHGQLGSSIAELASDYPMFDLVLTDIEELDICSKEAVSSYIKTHAIDYVLNCAAYTAVDAAEDNTVLAQRINAEAVANIAVAAEAQKATVIHISTDYVFDGKGPVPYKEEYPTSPTSIYGRTKREGEEMLFAYCKRAIVIRTAWLYSPFGSNFVKTMLRLSSEREQLKVVFDQIGSPTYASDLARAVLDMVSYMESHTPKYGVYHYSNEGVCSWYDFTLKILELAGRHEVAVVPVESSEYPVKAVRPAYSVLNKKKIKESFELQIPHWESSLKECMKRLL